jgi:hypothetical protein
MISGKIYDQRSILDFSSQIKQKTKNTEAKLNIYFFYSKKDKK